jgi:hypothetical protein
MTKDIPHDEPSRVMRTLMRLLALFLTLLACIIAALSLCNSLRDIFCHYQSGSGSGLSAIWCHYIDWDFRADVPVVLILGMILGALIFNIRLRPLKLPAMFRSVAILWIAVLLVVFARRLLHYCGIDYAN